MKTPPTLSRSWPEFPTTWTCRTPSADVLQHGNCCLLATTALSPHDPYLPTLLTHMGELLSTYEWVRVLLNFFLELRADERSLLAQSVAAAHPGIASAFVPGFKTLFWRRVLTPAVVGAFTHLFIFDSDMVVRPSQFDLVGLLRIGEVVNASLIAPAPYGTHAGMYKLGLARCPESDFCPCAPARRSPLAPTRSAQPSTHAL